MLSVQVVVFFANVAERRVGVGNIAVNGSALDEKQFLWGESYLGRIARVVIVSGEGSDSTGGTLWNQTGTDLEAIVLQLDAFGIGESEGARVHASSLINSILEL